MLSERLPQELVRYLADAEVEVVSWNDGGDEKLVLKVSKEIGPEVGFLSFGGARQLELETRFTVATIECSDQPVSGDDPLGRGETVYFFRESWGKTYYVIAENMTYQVGA